MTDSRNYSLTHAFGSFILVCTVGLHILSTLSFPEDPHLSLASTRFSNGTASYEGRNISQILWGPQITCFEFEGTNNSTSASPLEICQKTRNVFTLTATNLHNKTITAIMAINNGEDEALIRTVFDYGGLLFTLFSVFGSAMHHSYRHYGSATSTLSTIGNIVVIGLQVAMVKNIGSTKLGIAISTTNEAGFYLVIVRSVILVASAIAVHVGHKHNREIFRKYEDNAKVQEKNVNLMEGSAEQVEGDENV